LMDPDSSVLRSLIYSSAPGGVNQLVLLLPRTMSPSVLLQRISEGAPGLLQLSIYFGVGYVFDEDSLISLGPSLSKLRYLKVLVIPAIKTRIKDITTEREIIDSWAKNLPLLKAVLMPSKRFFISTQACEECSERILEEEKQTEQSPLRLCAHEKREMARFWIAHDSLDDFPTRSIA